MERIRSRIYPLQKLTKSNEALLENFSKLLLVALLVRCTPPPSRKKRRTTPTISIHNSRFHCYSPDDLTRRLRNLYAAGIYRSIRGATNLGVLCRKERYTMAVFSRYCPLYSPFPRSGEIILCARTKEIMLALLRSLPPSLSRGKLFLSRGTGTGFAYLSPR